MHEDLRSSGRCRVTFDALVADLQEHLTERTPLSLRLRSRCGRNLVSASRSWVPIHFGGPLARGDQPSLRQALRQFLLLARNFTAMSECAPNYPAIHPQRRSGDCGSQRTGDVSHERRNLLRLSEALDERGGPDLCEEFSLNVRK
jgi:hypothetical protein